VSASPAQAAAGGSDRTAANGRGTPNVVLYSLVSGAASAIAGAVASLSESGPARIAVWIAVATAVAAVSGVAHRSAAVSSCWAEVRRARPWSGS
jgi:uncharacterized BrkB/YihY/UPF0761 family membrane protein